MRSLAPSLLLVSIFASANSSLAEQPAPAEVTSGACTLIIHVTGIRNQKGKIGAELFRSSAGWPEDVSKSFRHEGFPFHGSTATLTFNNVPPGRYGVVVLHDENENEKLDRNWLGIPTEGFGVANNPHVLLSAPPFKDAIVPVTCPTTSTTIHLIYK